MRKLSEPSHGVGLGLLEAESPPKSSATLESPSLFNPNEAVADSPSAYELKFLLSAEQAEALVERLRGHLAADPHADPALGGAYRTMSLYTDTPRFDVLRRTEGYATSKYRVRRYGATGPIFLERKDKEGNRVRKCRATVPASELALLTSQTAPPDWVGGWFRQQALARELVPVCRIAYERIALMGTADGGTVRVTFDRNVRGERADAWQLVPLTDAPELLPGRVVCEFKYRVSLPALLKDAVAAFGLNPVTVSKYRRFAKAIGLLPTNPAESGADAEGDRVDG